MVCDCRSSCKSSWYWQSALALCGVIMKKIWSIWKKWEKRIGGGLSLLLSVAGDFLGRKGADSSVRIAVFGNHFKEKDAPSRSWFFRFCQESIGEKIVVSWYRPQLLLVSLFTDFALTRLLLRVCTVPSLFFSGENLHLPYHRQYKDYLQGLPTLAMGFDYDERPGYRRFPLWLTYIFSPEFAVNASLEDIRQRLAEIEAQSHGKKNKFAALVARHDGFSLRRSDVVAAISTIAPVACAGDLCHNDESLRVAFADNKKGVFTAIFV
ncbi:unknown protein [Desulfotalea psychrophila LSv54]|uniref:Uncharacterized protein n=2 Tax=Desulfotalea psychrophila TaxID=84980 RepID=Q6ASB8_DESPS|nr:unknown protein [Desulfotalea psychrophila LSv54]